MANDEQEHPKMAETTLCEHGYFRPLLDCMRCLRLQVSRQFKLLDRMEAELENLYDGNDE